MTGEADPLTGEAVPMTGGVSDEPSTLSVGPVAGGAPEELWTLPVGPVGGGAAGERSTLSVGPAAGGAPGERSTLPVGPVTGEAPDDRGSGPATGGAPSERSTLSVGPVTGEAPGERSTLSVGPVSGEAPGERSTLPVGPIDPLPATVEWRGDHLVVIDQRELPGRLVRLELRTVDDVCQAIADLAVRGAPAIGAAAAFGVALAAVRGEDVGNAAARLRATRPTAVNLAWAVDRASRAADPVAEAVAIAAEDVAANRAMGHHGAALVPAGANVLTHCNAGGLATVGYGTALGVIRAAHEAGTPLHVWVDETRPVLQGARLTAWELGRLGVPATLVPDAMAGSLMASGDVDLVVVGADRIAANGDVANKIGTYTLAVLAHHHGVPFYVVAPRSTFDPATADGAAIEIERRSPEEVTSLGGVRVAPDGMAAENRAFDVTPAALVTAYVTEEGVHRRP